MARYSTLTAKDLLMSIQSPWERMEQYILSQESRKTVAPEPTLSVFRDPSKASNAGNNMKNLLLLEYSLRVRFVDIVIARRPKADVAISYPSKDRGCSDAKAPFDDVHSFDL